MVLTYTNGVFVFNCTKAERFVAKDAKFLWHGMNGRCLGKCVACSAGVGQSWWTKHHDKAVTLIKYADEPTKKILEQYQTELLLSRAASVKDTEEFARTVPTPEGLDYYPFQKAGIEYALRRKNTLIGDEMGCGKTPMALGVINATPNLNKILILCPASIRTNWEREARRWLTSPYKIYPIFNGDELLDLDLTVSSPTIVIINYDKMVGETGAVIHDKLMSITWDLLIADEVHLLKSGSKVQRGKAVLGEYNKRGEIINKGLVHQSNRLLFLTGTPLPNRPKELWPLAQALDPEDIGARFTSFHFRYCAPFRDRWGWNFDGASNLDEIQNRMRNRFMIRRRKVDVLKELPPKTRQIIELDPNGIGGLINEQAAAFVQHEQAMNALQEATEIAEVLEDEQSFIDLTKQLDNARQVAFEAMAKERHRIAVAKIPYVIEHLTNFLESGDSKILVFVYHHDVVDGISEALDKLNIKYVSITGKTPMHQRQDNVDAFQTNPEVRVFIGNLKAAGVGITLTAADTVLFAEMSWLPSELQQCEDRPHRIGVTHPVLVQYLVFAGSMDAKMMKTIVAKMEIIDAALDKHDDAIGIIDAEAALNKGQERKYREHRYPLATQEQHQAAAQIVQRLAGCCDGAVSRDDAGFNKLDTRFGQELAIRSIQRELTDGEVQAIKKLCRKYHRQIDENLWMSLWGAGEIIDVPVVDNLLPPVI